MTAKHLARTWSAVAAGMLLLGACGSDKPAASKAATSELDTIKSGVLRVAIQPYGPYTSQEGAKITGLDGDILHAVADKLGLSVETQVTDFAGMLAGVQSRRVDITIGGIAWTAERQKQGLFTEPPYYSPPAMAVQPGKSYKTVKDLEGKPLGTVEGYVWVKSIQAVPGAKLHAYPDAESVLLDLSAGRIDVGFLDPLIIIDAEKKRGVKIETQYLDPPTADQVKEKPAYDFFRPYMTSYYIPKQSPKLEAAFSAEIRKMFENGEMQKLIEKWGGDPAQFLKPTPEIAKARQGVDRPADWQPPTI
jgi:polar amino acid transport system substrate-binding protein